MIFVDMDDVIADHSGHLCALLDIPNYKDVPEEDFIRVQEETEFYYDMPKTSSADKLISAVVDLYGEYSILTTPSRFFWYKSVSEKTRWISENLLIKPKDIIFTKDKQQYAKGNILIDDYRININKWIAGGGTGIKFKANSKNYTVDDLILILTHMKDHT